MTGDTQIVWIAEVGVYSERCVVGVYASAEAAMAAYPVSDADRGRWPQADWKQRGPLAWDNGCDFEAACSVEGYEVIA